MIRREAANAPSDPCAFMAWFEQLCETGPGQRDPLFPWLASTASLAEMRWFLTQEAAGEAGFDDLVALTQIGVTVAFGVLLDTFLVRSILVPALTIDLDERVWWPSALARRPAGRAEVDTQPA